VVITVIAHFVMLTDSITSGDNRLKICHFSEIVLICVGDFKELPMLGRPEICWMFVD
jgi:hypothetical protein